MSPRYEPAEMDKFKGLDPGEYTHMSQTGGIAMNKLVMRCFSVMWEAYYRETLKEMKGLSCEICHKLAFIYYFFQVHLFIS